MLPSPSESVVEAINVTLLSGPHGLGGVSSYSLLLKSMQQVLQ